MLGHIVTTEETKPSHAEFLLEVLLDCWETSSWNCLADDKWLQHLSVLFQQASRRALSSDCDQPPRRLACCGSRPFAEHCSLADFWNGLGPQIPAHGYGGGIVIYVHRSEPGSPFQPAVIGCCQIITYQITLRKMLNARQDGRRRDTDGSGCRLGNTTVDAETNPTLQRQIPRRRTKAKFYPFAAG